MSKRLLGRPDTIITSNSNGVELISNSFRPSTASDNKNVLYGPSTDYRTEEWRLYYHSVDKTRNLSKRSVTCLLPDGYEKAYLEMGNSKRKRGPIYKVRAWGIEFSAIYLEKCMVYIAIRNVKTKNAVERASWDLRAVGWELPGHFTIGSKEHPLIAKSPSGNEYSYESWCSYEHALEILNGSGNNDKKKERS